ncbi:MAG: class I SAM-dependent methyltransferase [Balneolaceae bacterium]
MTEGKNPGWFPDEMANAGRENMDADHAALYDSKEDADAAGEMSLLTGCGLNSQSEVVDLGAGTGQFTLAAAPNCARVIAVDISSVMLGVLKAKVDAANLSNVEIVQAGFLTYEHRGKPADFVYSRYALHHLPDLWKAVALNKIRRIVRPGSLLRLWDIVYNFGPDEAEDRLEQWCATISDNVTDNDSGGWRRSDIEEHIRDEHSTFTWFLEPLIEQSGFEIEDAMYSPDGIFAKYIARAI